MKVVADRFEVVRHARSGGMGEVFLCTDRAAGGSRVAVKVLSTTQPKIVERFLREAQILAEVDHPAIVRHVAHGVHEEVPFLAMKWIEGETLSERLARGPLTLAETVAVAERVAEALALVHARGIVHRDVKPSNIVLEGGAVSRAVLLDFGIAHVLEAGGELTRTGDLLGTPGYMAPEQASGAAVDVRTDVFALGCVIFRCLGGKTPFGGSDPLAIAIKLLLEDAPRLSTVAGSIPPGLDALVARMLARAKDDRPADGRAIRAALARLFDAESPTQSTPPAAASSPTLGAEERRVMSLVLARAPSFEPTVASVEALRDVLAEPVVANGAVLDVLADGSIIITARGGAPHDVAMRAARCALVLREELPDVKVVVTSGHGVLEADTPVGELVDRAVKLLDEGDDTTTIRIDAMSAGLLAGRFDVDGDSQVAALRGERRSDRARTLLGRPTPFVGRAREVATLDAMLEECAVESVARAVLVSANPGVGKTRLREEFLRRARARDDARTWIAFGDPIAKASPLGLLAQLLRNAFGFQRGDTLAQKQRRVVAFVERAFAGKKTGGPLSADPQRIAEFLGEIVGAPFADAGSVELRSARRDPQLLASRMRTAFEELVRAECMRGPLVLVLEDLHWGDAASVKLLDALLAAVSTSPLLVLAFARPEITRTHPDLFGERGLQEIKLLELSKRAATELVQKVLGDETKSDVVDLVVGRAQGNAFFLEELIRAVAEGRSDLPDTVVAMVEARLDELDPVARKVLRAASVYGEEASFGGVHALTGGDAHEIADVLGQLAESEYLSKVDASAQRGTDGTRYQFRHALVREAAYAMLTDEDRRLGHRLAAEWLEARGTQDPLVLADHFERGGEPERARRHFHHAAEQALARSDLDATLAFAHRAVDLGASGETLGALRLLQAEANIWRGDPQALGQAVETLSLVTSGSKEWYRAAAGVLFVAGQVADFGLVARTIHQLKQQEPRRDDSDTASMQAWAYSLATWLLALLGMYEMSREFHARASGLEDRGDDFSLGWIRTATFFVGKYIERDPWKAFVSVVDASRAFHRVGDARTMTLSRVLEGVALVELGAFEQARDVLRDALDMCERSQVLAARADAKRWLGHCLEGLGRIKEAAALEEEARTDEKATHIYRHAARASRGWLLAQLGELDAAAEHVRLAADDLSFAPSHRGHSLAWLARIEVKRGRPKAALQAAETAETLMHSIGALGGGESAIYVALVEALEASGSLDAARAKLAEGRASVLQRAEKIADPKYRASFLDRIPEHGWLRTREL